MPPLSCAHGDVSWMSPNWPSAEGRRVTAWTAVAAATLKSNDDQSRAITPAPLVVSLSNHERRARPSTSSGRALMGHSVDEIVDTELIRFVRLIDRPQARSRPLPELRDVGVVVHDHLQALPRVVVLVNAAEDRFAVVVRLRHDVQIVDLEKRVKDRMARLEIVEADVGQHALHVRLERIPAGAPEIARHLEIVDDDESALLHVRAQARGLAIGQRP